LKQEIEIVKLADLYHSVLLGGRVFIRDSALPLEDSLIFCFKQIPKGENLSITTTCYGLDETVKYETYLDSKC